MRRTQGIRSVVDNSVARNPDFDRIHATFIFLEKYDVTPPPSHSLSSDCTCRKKRFFKKSLIAIALASALSLTQAADTLTESSFVDGVYNASSSQIGSVNFTGNTGSTFTLNPSDPNGTVVIAPSLDSGAAIYIDGGSSQSTLNITGSVDISGPEGSRLTTTDSPLIAVGDTKQGGRLNISGNLSISNVDVYESSGASVINVGRSQSNGSGSNLTVGNISIDNVTVNNTKSGSPVTATSILEVTDENSSRPISFTAGDISISNSTAEHVMDFENAQATTGKILIEGGSFSRGIYASTGADVTIGSIEMRGTDLSSSLLLADKDADLSITSGITVQGTENDHIQASGRGDNKLIRFQGAASVNIGGDVKLEYIDSNSGLIFVHEVDNEVSFGDIALNHIKIDAQQAAVKLGDDTDEAFSLTTGDISVRDLSYVEADRYQFGVVVSRVSDASVGSIYVDGITYGETTGYTSGQVRNDSGGIKIQSTTFADTLSTLTAKNITSNDTDTRLGYTGINMANSTASAARVVVDSIQSKGETITTEGLSLTSSILGYGSVLVNNITSGGDAYGLQTSGSSTLTGLADTDQAVIVTNIEGTRAYGVSTSRTQNTALTGKQLWIENVTATGGSRSDDGDAVGLEVGSKVAFDNVTIKSVQGTKGVTGLSLDSSYSALEIKSLVIDGVTSTDAASTDDTFGIDGNGANRTESQKVDLITIKNVSGAGTGDVYGFYNQDSVWNGSQLVIDSVTAQNGNAFGFDSYGSSSEGSLSYGPTSVDYDVIAVSKVTGLEAIGFQNRIRSSSMNSSVVSDFIQVSGVSGTNSAIGLNNLGTLNASSTLVLNVDSEEGDAVGISNSGTRATYQSGVNFVDGVHGATSATGFDVLASLTASTIAVNDIDASAGEATGIHIQDAKLSAPQDASLTLVATNIDSNGGDARGIFVDGRNSILGETEFISVYGVSAVNGKAYGILNTNTTSSDTFSNTGGIFVQRIASTTSDAYGVYLQNKETSASEISILGVSAKGSAYGLRTANASSTSLGSNLTIAEVEGEKAYGLSAEDDDLTVSGTTTVTGILGTDTAVALSIDGGRASFADVLIAEVDATEKSALVSAKSGAEVSIDSGIIRSAAIDAPLAYEGNFGSDVDADTEVNHINRIALRSVSGSSINLGQSSDQGGRFTIVGDIVAGRGTQSESESGTISINAGEGSSIYGDVYAGNGGQITLNLSGSVLEGQIDDYHELATGTAESDSFRNAAFYDDDGNAIAVEEAGSVHLTLADSSKWVARGQSFVEKLTFADASSVVDLSQNDNSSVTIGTLAGSNGVFKMKLGKPQEAEDGLIHSDMLYIDNLDPDSQNMIEVTFADGVTSFEELDGLRFATSGHVDSTKHLQLKVQNQGFFNRTLTVELEDYQEGDEDNAKYNGTGNGEGTYKPGEDAVDGMFDTGDTNWIINSAGENPDVPPTVDISDAGQTILGTARATYLNSVIIDRFNQRYGDRVYDRNRHGVWARVRYDHVGTDAGIGDFSSDNTTYQVGYDYTKPTDNGKMIWGAAIDYMDGRTDYKSIKGDGGTDRVGGLLYATYLGDNGAYGDLVVRAGRLSADYAMSTTDGQKIDADYDNWLYGISFEVGHQLSNTSGWFLEPQLQAQYTHITDGDYRNRQTKVEQDAIDSLITRAGFRVGKFLSEDKSTLAYLKSDIMHEWLGEQDIRVYDVTTAAEGADVSINNHGSWFDVGGGFQAALTQDLYAYGDVEYRFGNNFENTVILNVGAKYRF